MSEPVNVDPDPLAEAAAALNGGEREPSEYVERCLDRIEDVDPEVHAFVDEPDRRGRLQGEVADLDASVQAGADRPALYGVPVGVKDIFHVDGLPTRANTEFSPDELAGPQAGVVSRLREAGALVLGKTVTTEFAYYEPGPTRNPHDLGHTPGGSSSGSAAAVAAGMCPLAVGSQTAGSTIRPAAFCGIVAFKPTYDRIPIDGVLPLAESLDTVGLFTADVAGARIAASVACDGWKDTVEPEGLPTLGVPDESYLNRASSVGRERFEEHVETLASAGFEVVDAHGLDDVDEVEDRHGTLMAAEAALAHAERYAAHPERYSTVLADLIEDGRAASVSALADARVDRRRTRERLEAAMAGEGIDVWLSPAAPGPAPEGIDDTGDPVMNAPWTYAGMPAVSVPAGDVEGLPIGLQCTGAGGDDERLLAWAGAIEATLAG